MLLTPAGTVATLRDIMRHFLVSPTAVTVFIAVCRDGATQRIS
jgi:hypothetical protein